MAEHPTIVPMDDLFRRAKPVIGVVHLLALPGSPRFCGSLCEVLSRAVDDARALAQGGVHAILVENYGDAPFYRDRVPPETIASMTVAASDVARSVSIPVGINVLRNDATAALSIAAAIGGQFIRVNVHTGVTATDQGLIEGRAAATLRLRHRLGFDSGKQRIHIFADVHVKHATPLGDRSLLDTARDTLERGLADALIVTGPSTGAPCDLEEGGKIKEHMPHARVLVGSGVTPQNVRDCLTKGDGVIVGTSLKVDGIVTNPVDPDRVRRLIAATA